jgi:trans-aconitate methyltransferase
MNKWNAELYDTKLAMVTHYGDNVLELLDPQAGERILDLGCGTGRHANMIAAAGASVIGIDSSPDMIEQAQAAYPEQDFRVADGHDFHFEEPFDGVFSNAALHWMLEPAKVIARIWDALKPGGRFVMEMGGRGNNILVRSNITKLMAEAGYPAPEFPWYFPSIGEYVPLLEAQGFRPTFARLYDRPTKMVDPESGLRDWLTMFGKSIFAKMPADAIPGLLSELEDRLRPDLHVDGFWYIDYVRLQVKAEKPA